MPTSYPGALDSLTNPTANDTLAAVPHHTQHANANDAIEALEAKVGIGASTTFDVRDYGAISNAGDATHATANTTAIQSAIDDCAAHGGGIVRGLSLYSIDGTLRVTTSDVRLDFGFHPYGIAAVESGTSYSPLNTFWINLDGVRSGLIWDGADGGTMVNFSPDWESAPSYTTALKGVGFRGALIAGREPYSTAANVGVYVSGTVLSDFESISGFEFKTAAVYLYAENRTNGSFSPSVAYNRFGFIFGRAYTNSGAALLMDGTAASNCFENHFGTVIAEHMAGHGLDLRWVDHNTFDIVEVGGFSGYSGIGLRLAANATTDGLRPVYNRFGTVVVNNSVVTSENGATVARSPQHNYIAQYSPNVAVAAVAPTVGANSTLYWNHDAYPGAGMVTNSAGEVGVGVTPTTGKGPLQLAGGLGFPATQVPSADVNTLDDYEEGPWTAGLTFVTAGDQNIVLSASTGSYIKIGKLVWVFNVITTSTFTHTTASGLLKITGLPFSMGVSFPFISGMASGWTKAGYQMSGLEGGSFGQSLAYPYMTGSGVAGAEMAVADHASGTNMTIWISGMYQAAA